MNKPDIRFNGFNEEWTEKKFEDLVDVQSGRDYKHLSEGTIPVYGTGGYMLSVDEALSYNEDAVGIGRKGTIDKPYILKAPFWTVDTLFYSIPKNKMNLDFIFSAFQTIRWKDKDESTGVPSLSKNAINSTEIKIPNESAEQKKLGALFSQIDSLIASIQKEHDKLVTLKKCMLQKMFPKKGSLVPEIRFEGFSGDWVEKKITDLATIFIGLVTTMTKYYSNQGTLLIRNSDIKDNYFSFSDNPIYLNQEFADQNSSRKHKIGDVITVHTGDVGTSAVITEKEEGTIGFATIVTRPKTNLLDSMFLSIFLNSDAHKIWAVSVSTGDGRTNYNLGDYTQLLLKIPSLPEQQKIGSYFQNLDNLISKQSAELEKLKNVKKTLLSKMFV
ncbi:restriction endonuclease subunit S [Treponema sp.]|uniref:restriction endonuclease subunit S n=1 Tax=Treponema sp. TaxID=166 RepID=UPI00298D7C8B|nr:restriction endonuclease subunit S [Treponema sp.]